MAAQSLVLTATSSPAVVAGSFGTLSYHGYIRCHLRSISGTNYLGDSGVTTGGFPLSSGDSFINVQLNLGETLWFACSSGATATLAVLRVNETT